MSDVHIPHEARLDLVSGYAIFTITDTEGNHFRFGFRCPEEVEAFAHVAISAFSRLIEVSK